MMNKRIMEFAEQCGFRSNPDVYDRNQSFDIEKFADLIVRECIDCVRGAGLADDVALRNKFGFNDGIAEGVVHIQKHFGVEE